MDIFNYRQLLFIIVLLLVSQCCTETRDSRPDKSEDPRIPNYVKKLNNVTVYSPDVQQPDTVELVRKQVFETNKEVLIKGYTGDIAVDDENRVYIVGSVPGTVGVYVFKPDGSFITKFARAGRGPGEFISISSMEIQGNRLFIYDPKQKKISIYSTNDYSHIKDMVIGRQRVQKDGKLAPLSPSTFSVLKDGTFVMGFQRLSLAYPNQNRKKLYYKLSAKGEILPEKLLQTRRYRFYISDRYTHSKPFLPLPQPIPFSRGSLTVITDDGQFYTVWTDDFLLKMYDEQGKYQRAFYYPYQNATLDLSNTSLEDAKMDAVRDNEDKVPASWPAIHTMELDDQGRLWIFTITDSDSTYKGWVLDRQGKLLARFEWPGKRSSRTPKVSPLLVIKNGYLYTRELDIPKGIDRIVKHKISFE